MPKARTIKQRCTQILHWLEDERPCGRPVDLKFVRWTSKENKEYLGEAFRDGNRMCIRLNMVKCRTYIVAIDVLLHEYTHCCTWGVAKIEDIDKLKHHDSSFWCVFGDLYNSYNYSNGYIKSRGYEIV